MGSCKLKVSFCGTVSIAHGGDLAVGWWRDGSLKPLALYACRNLHVQSEAGDMT